MRTLNAAIMGLLLAFLPCLATATDLAYRWVDADGVVHFSDRPPPEHFTAVTLPLPEYEPPEPPTARERLLEARLARLNAYLEALQEKREQAELERARAQAAALRAQLAAERSRRNDYRRPIVHGVWFPPFFPHPGNPHPPVDPPLSPDSMSTGSAFDRLAEAKDRIGAGR